MNIPEQFRDPELEMSGEIIGFYPREFYVLDNFAAFQVDFADRRWMTSEHAYHAMKFIGVRDDIVEQIAESRSPHEALKIATEHRNDRFQNWDEIKVDVMEAICRAKMEQNPYVAQKLLKTGDLDIVEDSPKDDFWGWGKNRDGQNQLGRIWMKLREELKSNI